MSPRWVELRGTYAIRDLREARDDLRVAQSMCRLLHNGPDAISTADRPTCFARPVSATSAATSTAAAGDATSIA